MLVFLPAPRTVSASSAAGWLCLLPVFRWWQDDERARASREGECSDLLSDFTGMPKSRRTCPVTNKSPCSEAGRDMGPDQHTNVAATPVDTKPINFKSVFSIKGEVRAKLKFDTCRAWDADSDGVCLNFVRSTVFEIFAIQISLFWRRHGAPKWWRFRDEWKQRARADSTVEHCF